MVKRSEVVVTLVVSGSNLGDGIFFKNYYYFYFKTTMRVLAKIVLYYVQIQVSMKHSPPPKKRPVLSFVLQLQTLLLFLHSLTPMHALIFNGFMLSISFLLEF